MVMARLVQRTVLPLAQLQHADGALCGLTRLAPRQAARVQQHRAAASSSHAAAAAAATAAGPTRLEERAERQAARAAAGTSSLRDLGKVYAQLSKARLSMLVVLSGTAGFLLAGAPVAVDTLAALTVGTAMHASAANTFNQVYERKTDALMKRTCARPLPSGRVSTAHAVAFGLANTIGGTVVLGTLCNPLTAVLGLGNVFLYAGVYTPMKRLSEWNTWVGALVGGIPPLMGYAAATGTIFSVEAALVSSALVLWQFPHFFALAYMAKRDYAAGGHQMVPCNDPTAARTASLITRYSVAMATIPLASYSLGVTSAMFPLESIAFNGILLHAAYKFNENPNMGNARRVFRISLWYLPLVLALMVFHKNEWADPEGRGSFALAPSCPVHASTSLAQSAFAEKQLSNEEITSASRSITLEGALRCAKAQLRDLCLHEIMVPPLTRLPSATKPSASDAELQAASATEPAASSTPLCPVSQVASKALR
ncbi:Protoheme IX farnesyltransferase, mitochondrial [Hondaea fermentalgiana]|uniref:Protoheme IX farnesyltransferase, mitochondrial n=1 Tax=Hondaea fermentalgiana TaxID=2315210 RepID=A0A2R5GCQ0_9STRA|nr:Protoheme IX farnesyltransferase, mitochondrial [Hondaea fermentalgiana]|eukprot:GBG28757.1 Protoheme IX farnesyltransferase, mitochondrial [Hondaea fermentalgiana]